MRTDFHLLPVPPTLINLKLFFPPFLFFAVRPQLRGLLVSPAQNLILVFLFARSNRPPSLFYSKTMSVPGFLRLVYVALPFVL